MGNDGTSGCVLPVALSSLGSTDEGWMIHMHSLSRRMHSVRLKFMSYMTFGSLPHNFLFFSLARFLFF
ncbi:hypothetical protein BRADI_5g04075v3 [Brachypodium distachyon]|uniref:Uncharacterized protein n=1 Tax=Brachypodium distachyon TaxID=15368 RepID=A0A2K2CFG0_BRADI|nr:hypothetical protein BRADI_5g04075v3 [Brachypodium distachyon]